MRRALTAMAIMLVATAVAIGGSVAYFSGWDRFAGNICALQWTSQRVTEIRHAHDSTSNQDDRLKYETMISDYNNWLDVCEGRAVRAETSSPATSPSSPALSTSATESSSSGSSKAKPSASSSKRASALKDVNAKYACRPTFYAGEPGSKGLYTYGKPVNAKTASQAVAELKRRINCDPVLLVQIAQELQVKDWGLARQHQEAVKLAKLARQGKYDEWNGLQAKVVKAIDASKAKLSELKPGAYKSFVMTPHPQDGVPVVSFVTVYRNGDEVLEFILQNGQVRKLRLVCGLQLQVPQAEKVPVHAVNLTHQNIPRSTEGNPVVPVEYEQSPSSHPAESRPSSPRSSTPSSPKTTPSKPSTPSTPPTSTPPSSPPATCPPGQHGTPPNCLETKDPSKDPEAQGHAPVGGGHNDTNGPGERTDEHKPTSSASRTNPAPPPATTAPPSSSGSPTQSTSPSAGPTTVTSTPPAEPGANPTTSTSGTPDANSGDPGDGGFN